MKAAMTSYLREPGYEAFIKIIESGATYEDYVGVLGNKRIPVKSNNLHLHGLHQTILAHDIRWVRHIRLQTLVMYMTTQPYNKELDDYLTHSMDYNVLLSLFIENYGDTKLRSVKGMSLFTKVLTDYDIQDWQEGAYRYRYMYEYLKTIEVTTEEEAYTLVRVSKTIHHYFFKGVWNLQYPESYALYQEAHKHVEDKLHEMVKLNKQWEELDKQAIIRQDNCNMCDFLNENPIQEVVGDKVHKYTRVEQEDGTHKIVTFISTRFTVSGVGIQSIGDFCSHCGRNVNDNRRYCRNKGESYT